MLPAHRLARRLDARFHINRLRGTDGNNVIADYGLYSDWCGSDRGVPGVRCFAAPPPV
jgi:hypothetical protein